MPRTRVGKTHIHWRLEGQAEAPPLVMLHSIGTSMSLYDRCIPFLAPHFRILRMDLRGHGGSGSSPNECTLAQLGDDVAAVMDEVSIEHAVICGTSLGGMIAMQFAIDRPHRTDGLVLACTSASMSPELWPERLQTVRAQGLSSVAKGWAERHFSHQFIAAENALVKAMEQNFASMDASGYLGTAAAIRDMDLLEKVGGITVPTMVIAGETDIATPLRGHGDQIAAAIPSSSIEILDAAHLACVEQPEQFSLCVYQLAARCTLSI